jgi:hypothetical protein
MWNVMGRIELIVPVITRVYPQFVVWHHSVYFIYITALYKTPLSAALVGCFQSGRFGEGFGKAIHGTEV